MTNDEAHEKGYIEGRRRTAINQLSHALRELLGVDLPEDQALITISRLTLERQEAIQTIRTACRYNDIADSFEDNIHLSDIIEKHLLRGLDL
jgi:hypothetical protein